MKTPLLKKGGEKVDKRYAYADFEEYCCITDTQEAPKKLEDFKQELINDGTLEDYDGDMEVIEELAQENYDEYLIDYCMGGHEIFNRLNEQEEKIQELESEIKFLKIVIMKNEQYIDSLTHKTKWNNTCEKEFEGL